MFVKSSKGNPQSPAVALPCLALLKTQASAAQRRLPPHYSAGASREPRTRVLV